MGSSRIGRRQTQPQRPWLGQGQMRWQQPTLRRCLPHGKVFRGNMGLKSPSLGWHRPQELQGWHESHSCPCGRCHGDMHRHLGLSSFRPRASGTRSRAPQSPTASRSRRVSGRPAPRVPALLTAGSSALAPQPPAQHLPQHRRSISALWCMCPTGPPEPTSVPFLVPTISWFAHRWAKPNAKARGGRGG